MPRSFGLWRWLSATTLIAVGLVMGTSVAGAQDAHKLLPSARMVVVEGGGNHGQSFSQPPNNCVQGYLNRYLATGALPQGAGLVNATCPAVANTTAGG